MARLGIPFQEHRGKPFRKIKLKKKIKICYTYENWLCLPKIVCNFKINVMSVYMLKTEKRRKEKIEFASHLLIQTNESKNT